MNCIICLCSLYITVTQFLCARLSEHSVVVKIHKALGKVPVDDEGHQKEESEGDHRVQKHPRPVQNGQRAVAQERYVVVVREGNQPQGVAEQGGHEPGLTDEEMIEKQLHEMKDHQ